MYTHITLAERERIGILLAKRWKIPRIAEHLNRHATSIRRELRRSKPYFLGYSALTAEKDAYRKRHMQRRMPKLDQPRLFRAVEAKLRLRWSPEQIAHWLKATYAGDDTMQVSHEAIYTYIYVLPRGALRKALITQLRQGSRGRQRRKRGTDERGKIPNMISIHERPQEVESRTVPGHWESDLLIGARQASAIGTLVERTTRTTILVPLKAKDPVTVRKAFARVVKQLPRELTLSLTHDRGFEMRQHELFTKDTQVQVFFADPHSPWQRGTNENTNGLVRDFFPKGTDFGAMPRRELKRVQRLLNERPRKTLGWKTPKEAFQVLLKKRAVRG